MRLGPHSACSDPGPVAFGRGGTQQTVTDANVVLGRIGSNSFIGGRLSLDAAAATSISDTIAKPLGYTGPMAVDKVAQGILDMANVKMAGAIKEITVERGRDVRDYTLVVFCGGGPLVAAELARDLGIPEIVVPPHPGAFSSLGMLMTEARRAAARTFLHKLEPQAVTAMLANFEQMESDLKEAMGKEFDVQNISYLREADMKYAGQAHSVKISLVFELGIETIRVDFEKEYSKLCVKAPGRQ
jgi:N-methylhydantoinase A